MIATIQKWGNSNAVRLPKNLLSLASIADGEKVNLFVEDGKMVIEKLNRRHKTLAERLAGFRGEYSGGEWDTAEDVGEERYDEV